MGRLIVLLGGARSGKSHLAQELAETHPGPVTYVATAQAGDEEMTARIQAHRQARPSAWQTLEAPYQVAAAWRAQDSRGGLALLDCLTFLVTNVILRVCPDPDIIDESAAQEAVSAEIQALLELIEQEPADWIVVSNEVGLGLVPPYPLGRVYRDLLGWANQKLAAAAQEAYFLVAGIPVPLHMYRAKIQIDWGEL